MIQLIIGSQWGDEGKGKIVDMMAQKADLAGKTGGAFGSYTHSGDAPKIIADTMEFVFKMNLEVGSFNLLEEKLTSKEGLKACQDLSREV